MDHVLHIQLLGKFRLELDGKLVHSERWPQLQSLLAYLVIHRDNPQPRQRLAALFYPDSSDVQAKTNVRSLVHRLQRVLPDTCRFVSISPIDLQWRLDASYVLDIAKFEDAVVQARRATSPSLERLALEHAVTHYQGDLLPDWYDDWVEPARERLRQAYLAALQRLSVLGERERDYAMAITYALALQRHDPLHEEICRRLMHLYAASGDRALALSVYHRFVDLLQRDLGAEPSCDTRELYERLLRTNVAPAASTEPPQAPAALGPLVGRQREWIQLQEVWRRANAGASRFVLLSGEAGIGKTRLAEELLAWSERLGHATARARCYAAEGGLVYAPIAAWLRSAPIRVTLPQLDKVWLTEVARFVPELLTERSRLPHPSPLSENWQRQRLFEALARAVIGDRRLRLLLIDDLQWCDRETLEWLHFLLRFDSVAPLLVVGTVRAEETDANHPLAHLLNSLRRGEQVTEITLEPLDAAETLSLATAVAGHDLDPSLAQHLYRESEGNPLFVVEMIRVGAEWPIPGALGAVEGGTGMSPSSLPTTVQAVIQERLAQLTPDTRTLVNSAATIGRAFTVDVLARASRASEQQLLRALDELWQRRIVREQDAESYDFSHDKLREVAYTALSPVSRRALHRRVAEAIEEVHAEELCLLAESSTPTATDVRHSKLSPVYPLLAHHWKHAGNTTKATNFLARAGEQALQSYAHREAVRFLEEAVALQNSQSAVNDSLIHGRLEVLLGEAYFAMGDTTAGRLHLERAVALLGWPVPPTTIGLTHSTLVQALQMLLSRVDLPPAEQPAALERSRLLQAARAYERLGEIYFFSNESVLVAYAGIQNAELAQRAGPSPELARAYANMCLIAGIISLHAEAEACRRLARDVANRVSDGPAQMWVNLLTGLFSASVGRWDDARTSLEESINLAHPLATRGQWGESSFVLAQVAHYVGDYATATAMCAGVYAAAKQNNSVLHQIWGLAGQGQTALRLGRITEAIAFLESAAALLREHSDRTFQIIVYGNIALAHLRQGDPERAQHLAERAARLIDQSSAPPTAFYALDSYAGVVEVFIALLEALAPVSSAKRTALEHEVSRACDALDRHAHAFPMGRPRALLLHGRRKALSSTPVQALRDWHEGLEVAHHLVMPYEQALAHFEIGRRSAGSTRHVHLRQAHDLFAALGASYELAAVDAVPWTSSS